ncbi:putative chromosome segregation atpase family protein [Erysiphe necator]|uniref:Putative chromosome segregation atpase family protein n=1 Tax=Uncinula necator TaxID=52586 RepID=A0A0B1P6C4_UNCNE|nr:putative chromosome segregation atpase family protein [Erysiphe necator]
MYRWDSSDPERAPPPLPMNPSSPSLASKPNTSVNIHSAHVALAEKAWESGYVTNPPPKRIEYSPERLLMKGVAHKRIKSLQPNIRDLNNSLEGGTTLSGPRSLEKSPTRRGASFTTKNFSIDNKSSEKDLRNFQKGKSSEKESKSLFEEKSLEKQRNIRHEQKHEVTENDLLKDKRKEEDSNQSETLSSSYRDSQINDTLQAPSSLRRPHQSILGENTSPQSATMLALQSIASKDNSSILRNITNDSTALIRTPQAIDTISNQIISLTNIATSLQREMAQLSRRSKDNATDLISLKEATNARDEDIRKSLRELVHNLNQNGNRSSNNTQGSGGLYLDNKAHNSSAFRGVKGFSLPRISSPASFTTSLDRESIISPASYVADGVAIIALLEKVLREMATREGQERVLSQISNYLTHNENSTEKKVDDLIVLIKSNYPNSDSLSKFEGSISANRSRTLSLEPAPRLELDFEKPQTLSTSRIMTLKSSTNGQNLSGAVQMSEIFNEDIIKLIRTIKDSVTQGGGLTAEVKALVRELRGEVLGMGREIGRKLEEVNEDSSKTVTLEKELVSRLLKNGIDDLKTHVDQILREYRRQSVSSLASKTIVDYQEILNAVRDAVVKIDQSRGKNFEKQDILDAVKDAWENYRPEFEFQQFGLERDELLTCLKEGIQKYAPNNNFAVTSGATREEVYDAVVDGLKNFSLPSIDTAASISRDDILIAFREILEEVELPSLISKSIEKGISKNDMLDIVKEGLQSFDFSPSIITLLNNSNMCLSRNGIPEAPKNSIKGFEAAKKTNDILFKAVESGEGPIASRDEPRADIGHISEIDAFISQICDKFKNILDSTRTELEIVSKEAKKNLYSSTDVTEKLLETIRDGIEKIHLDMGEFFKKSSGHEVKDTIEDIKNKIDSLREEVEWLTSSNSPDSPELVLSEIKNLREILLATTIPNSEDRNLNIVASLEDGLESVKQMISSSLILPGSTNDENKVLIALKDGLDTIKEEISISRRSETSSDQMIILDTIRDDIENIKEAVSSSFMHKGSELDKEEIIDTIKDELQSLKETMSSALVPSSSGLDRSDILCVINDGFDNIKESISSSIIPSSSMLGREDILGVINQGFDNIRDTMTSSLVPCSSVLEKDDILRVINDGFENVKEAMSSALVPSSSGLERDFILSVINDGFDNIKETMSTSLVHNRSELDKDEIIDTIKDGLEGLKETMSSSLVTRSSEIDRDDLIGVINDGFENIKETMSTSLVHDRSELDKEEILDTIKDEFESLKETISSALISNSSELDKQEALGEITIEIKSLKDIMSASLVPNSSGIDRDDILGVINDGFDNIKETMSTSLVHNRSELDKNEIIDTIKDGLEGLKETMSSSLVPSSSGLERDVILSVINDGFDNIKETMSTSLVHDRSELDKNEIIDTIKDGLEGLKETMSSSLVTRSSEIDRDNIVGVINDGFNNIKETMSSSMVPSSSGIDRDEILCVINGGFDNIKEIMSASITPNSSEQDKEEFLDVIKTELLDLKETFSTFILSGSSGLDRDEFLNLFTDSFDSMKENMLSSILPSCSDLIKDDILGTIKEDLDDIKEKFSTFLASNFASSKNEVSEKFEDGTDNMIKESSMRRDSVASSEEMINFDTIKCELENIKATMSSCLINRAPELEKDEIINAMKIEIEGLKDTISSSLRNEDLEQDNNKALNAIKHDFESLRQSISPLLISNISESFNDHALQALQKSIDNIKEEITIKKSLIDQFSVDEIVDTIKTGLSNVQVEIGKVADKTVDSTVIDLNQDLHKTLKDGLENVRINIHQLQKSIEDIKSETEKNSSLVPLDLVRKANIDNHEAFVPESNVITHNIDSICTPFFKNDFFNLENSMKAIQHSLIDLAEGSQNIKEDCIKKEDLEALENLINDTKAKFDDIDSTQFLNKKDLEVIENLVRNTKAKFDDIDFKQFLNKDDLNPLELLIGGTQDDLSNLAAHLEDVSKKEDVGVIEIITRDILTNVQNLKDLTVKNFENPAVTKLDIFAVESVCSEIKCKLDKMPNTEISSLVSKEDYMNLESQVQEIKDQIIRYAKSNSKFSEDRHIHIISINETLRAIQNFLEEFEDTFKKKMGDSFKSTEALERLLKDCSETITRNANVSEDVRLLTDTVKDEFEKSTAAVVGSKLELDEKFQQNCEKIEEIFEKKFDNLLSKCNDTRLFMEGATNLSEEKMNQIEATLHETLTTTEDVKLLADNLTTSLTESRIILDKGTHLITDRVDETYARLKEVHTDTKAEHQQTRDNINKILCMIEGIDSTLKENSPKTAESLRDLCIITSKQHEDSKMSLSTLEEKINERLPIFESSTLLLPSPPSLPNLDSYIDNSAHEKLDRLVNGMNIASKSFSQLDMLEKIHQQLKKTAAEVSEYFNKQTKQIYDDFEEKKRATEEVSNILERKIAQKESAEDTVFALRQEEEYLRRSISELKAEQEGLTRKRSRLNAEVIGFETALKIRREELDIIEERARGLERRILESVVDHSRTLLISRTNKGREVMSRKRVPSHNGSVKSPSVSKSMNMSQVAVEMVTNGNQSAKKNPHDTSRRILSLSQITNNITQGSLKRCHSVKAPLGVLRKNSWGGSISLSYDHLNEKNLRMKENEEYDANIYDGILSNNNAEVNLPESAGSRVSEITTEDGTIASLERSDVEMDIFSEVETPVTAEIEHSDTFVVL